MMHLWGPATTTARNQPMIALRRCDFVFQNHRADDIRPYGIYRTCRRGDSRIARAAQAASPKGRSFVDAAVNGWLLAIKDRSCVIALRRCDFVFQNHRADDIRPYGIYRTCRRGDSRIARAAQAAKQIVFAGSLHNPSVKNQRFLPAPFTQGSLGRCRASAPCTRHQRPLAQFGSIVCKAVPNRAIPKGVTITTAPCTHHQRPLAARL